MSGGALAPQDELRIEFPKPIGLGDKVFDFIVLREPTIGDVLKAQSMAGDNPMKQNAHLIALVAGVGVTAVETMPLRKFKQAAEYIGSFLADGE